MTKRLFVAVSLPRRYLDIFGQYGSNYYLSGIKWTERENLHITVHFFGDVEEKKISPLTVALEMVAQQITPFVLNFDKIIFGPPERIPTMIWAVFHGHEEFQKLATLIYRETKKCLFEIQEPKFLPHITLARFKGFIDTKRLELAQFQLDDLKVESFCLMASELTAKGPNYTKLADFKLR